MGHTRTGPVKDSSNIHLLHLTPSHNRRAMHSVGCTCLMWSIWGFQLIKSRVAYQGMDLRPAVSRKALACALLPVAAVAAVILTTPIAHAAEVQFSGDGSNERPFTSSGCTARTSEGDCIVRFPARFLGPLQNEMIPSYRCPVVEPMLVDRASNRGDDSPRGVDAVGSSLLATFINPDATQPVGDGDFYAAGTSRGPLRTATNWNVRDGKYFIALFCTKNIHRSYIS